MSALEPIRVELSPFQKLKILRDQFEERQEELEKTEALIRDAYLEIETQRYLESLGPYYASNRPTDLPTAETITAMEQQRAQLAQLIATIEATIPVMMQTAEGKGPAPAAAAPSQPAGPARKVKFDSFDDFKQKKG